MFLTVYLSVVGVGEGEGGVFPFTFDVLVSMLGEVSRYFVLSSLFR